MNDKGAGLFITTASSVRVGNGLDIPSGSVRLRNVILLTGFSDRCLRWVNSARLRRYVENVITHPESSANPDHNTSDVHVVSSQGRTFILVGTAHVSRESADLVRDIIRRERPDCVCVELDEQRFQALSQEQRWEDLDLKEVIRRRQLSPLIVNLVLASYQKKLGGQLGVIPGAEMLAATQAAQALDIPIALCDRNVRVTLVRLWRSTSFYRKMLLLSTLIASLFERTEISEEMLRDIRQQDVLSGMLQELGEVLPTLQQVLIAERDTYLAYNIHRAVGEKIVAVVGAAHVPGLRQALAAPQLASVDHLETVPPTSPVWRWIGWAVPATILGAIALIAVRKGAAVAGYNLLFWILANGIPSALGALGALAHPLTIVTAFVAAPLTSLTPVIGAGYVTAFVQAYLQPPLVREFHSVAEDIRIPRQWWRNRLLRIFLAFLLPTLGSLIGTWIGAYGIFGNVF